MEEAAGTALTRGERELASQGAVRRGVAAITFPLARLLASRPALLLALLAAITPDAHAACAPPARPRLAEILYDPAGADAGREFVELYNPTDSAWSLAGARLDVGDGSGPGRWSARWTGDAAHAIAPGARFVIGGAGVAIADAVASLDLQNGPDAVRLVWPDGVAEVVGYGAHEHAEYACGAPAADVASGAALARIPDDADGGSNAADFRAAPPTPGRPNQAARDAALVTGTLALDPTHPDASVAVRVRFAVAGAGAEALPAGAVIATAWLDDRLLGTRALDATLAPGETTWVEIDAESGTAGKRVLRARVVAAGDATVENDADSSRVRVGPGPLEVAEIQFHPEQGEGEWIEVVNRADHPVALAAFVFADRGSAGGTVRDAAGVAPADSARLAPGARGVVAQDRRALLLRHPRADSTRVWDLRPWSALNNSDGDDGYADVVTVREVDGTPCARTPYRAGGVPAGVPVERGDDGAWAPSLDPAGTPLAPPRALPPLAATFALAPRRVAPGDVVRLSWSLPWPRATLAIEVFDLEGTRVAAGPVGLEAAGRGEVEWTLPSLAPGTYVVALVARAPDGASVSGSRALRVRGATP